MRLYIIGQYSLCARQLGGQDFLREYSHIDFVAKEVMCHKTYRLKYIILVKVAKKKIVQHV